MEFLYIVIGLVLVFDFINGFHDSANSIATIVTTKVLSPFTAVLLAAFFNFIAFLVFPLSVATTIGKGIIEPDSINLSVIFAALIAAIIWNLLTWWWGFPSSSSHTLVGGLIGAAVAEAGFSSVILSGVMKIAAFIVISPLLGLIMSFLISALVMQLFKKQSPYKVDKYFRRLQLLSASAFSLGHGGNDAQKSMGIIWVALIVTGHVSKDAEIDLWIVLSCHTAIALGTLFGGWRIVKTIGEKITKLKADKARPAKAGGKAKPTAGWARDTTELVMQNIAQASVPVPGPTTTRTACTNKLSGMPQVISRLACQPRRLSQGLSQPQAQKVKSMVTLIQNRPVAASRGL